MFQPRSTRRLDTRTTPPIIQLEDSPKQRVELPVGHVSSFSSLVVVRECAGARERSPRSVCSLVTDWPSQATRPKLAAILPYRLLVLGSENAQT